jgi:hypothetical protein
MLVVNTRLRQLWESAQARPLVAFQAPGGFGKSTAAGWWAEALGKPVAWLRLEQALACRHEPAFIAALAGRIARAAGWPESESTTHWADVAELAARVPGGITVVLDDYHRVSHPELDRALSAFLAARPEGLTVLITTREPLQLPDWQARLGRREALLLTDRDLALDDDEAAAYLDLDAETASRIANRTGGWFFALNLLQDALQQGVTGWDADMAGRLETYLFDELLARYEPDVVTFMQRTALMGMFTLADCHALDLPAPEAQLRHLERERLFLLRQDDRFTYHALVREALIERMPWAERREWQQRIAQYLMDRDDEAALPLFLAAAAWPQAARAVAWFSLTSWRENRAYCPTLRYWFDQLPGDRLQGDPWYQLLHGLTMGPSQPDTLVQTSLAAAQRAFEARGDDLGHTAALYCRCRHHWQGGDFDRYRGLLPELAKAKSRLPDHHPVVQLVLDQQLNYCIDSAVDRPMWSQAMQRLMAIPPATRLTRTIQTRHHWAAAFLLAGWGEFEQAWRHWELALQVVGQSQRDRIHQAAAQSDLNCFIDREPLVSCAPLWEEARTVADPYTRLVLLAGRLAHEMAQHRWEGARAAGAELLAMESAPLVHQASTTLTDARLRLATIALHERQPAVAAALVATAASRNQAALMTADVAWYQARMAWEHGDPAAARLHLQTATAEARRWDQKFTLAKTLLLQALVDGQAAGAEALTLVSRWDYRFALTLYFPEALPLLEGGASEVGALLGHAAPVRIRTLGGLQVEVAGKPLDWKRSNAQLILLDLLLHPQGSTAEDMERRYWRATGNAGLRKDVQALREALEPDQPAKESRYVRLEGRRRFWTTDRTAYWWDAEAFLQLSELACTTTDPAVRGQALQAARDLQRGEFVPEWQGVAAFAPMRRRLAEAAISLPAAATAPLDQQRLVDDISL